MTSPDFTGERFIPGQGGAQIAYEHLHRYQFALRWAAGKHVLDVAAGIGYGAGLLAKAAERVWAVDLDAASVQYARRTFPAGNLMFLQGNAASLPMQAHSVDLVIALEVLEHVEDQEGLVAELARVVRPGGTVLISTPNKASYSDARNYSNPFHVHEFYREEFLALLNRHFKSIQLVQQQVRAGSLILNEEPGAGDAEVLAEAVGGSMSVESMYLLAFCRTGRRLKTIPAASAYLDTGDGLLCEWEQRLQAAGVELKRLNLEVEKMGSWCRRLKEELEIRDGSIRELQAEVENLSQWGRELQDTLAARDRTIQELQDTMQREVSLRDQELVQLRSELAERALWVQGLEEELEKRDHALVQLQSELAERTRWIQGLEEELEKRDQAILELQEAMQREVLLRDQELVRLRSELAERALWVQGLEEDLEKRDQALVQLQSELAERALWVQGLEEDLERRDQALVQLQSELAERTRWIQGLEKELETRDQALSSLQSEFAERSRWAHELEQEVAARDDRIKQKMEEFDRLQGEFDERGRWAQQLEREVSARDASIRKTREELDRVAAHLADIKSRRTYRALSRMRILPE